MEEKELTLQEMIDLELENLWKELKTVQFDQNGRLKVIDMVIRKELIKKQYMVGLELIIVEGYLLNGRNKINELNRKFQKIERKI